MISIWKRELRSALCSVTGFLYLAASLFFFGIYFYVLNLYQGSAHVNYAYASVVYLFSITTPILTMRSFAQEYRDKTDQLLFTAPVSLRSVVLGKYLACLTLFLIPALVAAAFPVILTGYGDVAIAEAYSTLLAYVLYGMAAIALGIFLSSLTNNVVIAAVTTAVVLFLVYTMGGFGELLGVPVIKQVLGAFHFQARFITMESGVISLRSVIYFLSVAAAFLVFTVIRLKAAGVRRGGNPKVRKKMAVWLLVTALITVGVNVGVTCLPDRMTEYDITMREFHFLTKETKNFLDTLEKDVKIYVYNKESSADVNQVKMLKNYAAYPHVSVEYVDPDVSPRFPLRYVATGVSVGSMIVTSGTAFRVVDFAGVYTYSDETMKDYGMQPDGFDLEGLLTSAIDFVTTDRIPKVYMLSGHGELLLAGKFLDALNRENVSLEEIQLVSTGSVPKDAECVLILSPSDDYSEEETKALGDYLDRGGHIYILLQWTKEPQKNLHAFLEKYGISVQYGVVSEENADVYFQEPYYLIPEIRKTKVTDGLEGNLALSAMTVGLRTSMQDAESILKTSDQAFLKKDPQESKTPEKEEGDETGEYSLGIFREWTVDLTPADMKEGQGKVTRQAQLTVFGSPYMTQDAIDEYISGMNRKMFVSIMSHMVSRPALTSVPVKSYSVQYVAVPLSDATFFGVVLSGVIPGVLLITGLLVWVLRRRR